MGQAKNRGSRTDRIDKAVIRDRLRFPPSVKCNTCQADLTEIHSMDTRGMVGLELAGAAECHACERTTWILKGDPDAVERAFERLAQTYAEDRFNP